MTPAERLRRVVGPDTPVPPQTPHRTRVLNGLDHIDVVAWGEDSVEITCCTDTETARLLMLAYRHLPALVTFAKRQRDSMDAEPNPRPPTGDDWNDLFSQMGPLL